MRYSQVPHALIRTATPFLVASPAQKWHWLSLHVLMAEKECMGRLEDARRLNDAAWRFACDMELSDVEGLVSIGLAQWDGNTLVLPHYNRESEGKHYSTKIGNAERKKRQREGEPNVTRDKAVPKIVGTLSKGNVTRDKAVPTHVESTVDALKSMGLRVPKKEEHSLELTIRLHGHDRIVAAMAVLSGCGQTIYPNDLSAYASNSDARDQRGYLLPTTLAKIDQAGHASY